MPKKKLDNYEYPSSAEKEKTLKYLQDTFDNRIDPDVVYFILSERDYDMESTLQALLTISNETHAPYTEEQVPELVPEPAQNENNCGEILTLSEILNSEVIPPVLCCSSAETCRIQTTSDRMYTPSTSLYQSNEALYTEESAADKTTADSHGLDYELSSPDKQTTTNASLDRQCTTHPLSERKNWISNVTKPEISIIEKKNDLNEMLSPQSDNSIEADAASDIIHVTSPSHEPRKNNRPCVVDEKHFNPSEMCASNRPLYYFPFVSSKVTPFLQPQQPSNLSSSAADRVLDIRRTEEKLLVLLRGLPGSGKSTLASKLSAQDSVICSSDYYFTHRGKYNFDPSRLAEAHEWNQRRARKFMAEGKPLVVIDNTNIEAWEMKPYVMYAQRYGYRVEILEPDTSWKFKPNELALRNVHGITREKIRSMLDRYDGNVTIGSILARLKRGVGSPSVDDDALEDALSDRTTRSSSCCDSPRSLSRSSSSRELKRSAKSSNSSESISPASPPLSPARSFGPPVKDTKVYVDKVNLNDGRSSKHGAAKHVDKWSRKTETHGDGLMKIQNTTTRKATAKTGPKPVSAVTSRTSRDMHCQTESPVRDVILRKNAADSWKDDYANEDEEFWGFDDRSGARKSSKAKDGSPHRARNRTRQSKGDARALEEIVRTSVVNTTLAGSGECSDDVERKAEENPPPVSKRTKTKIASSFAFPIEQYSGRRQKKVNARDVFTTSQFASGYECSVPQSRDMCGDFPQVTEKKYSELKELFPHVPGVSLAKLIAKCEGDVEWASNLLLDSTNEVEGCEEVQSGDSKAPKRELSSHVNAAIDEALNLIDRGMEDAPTETNLADPEVEARDSRPDEEDELAFELEPAFALQLEQLFGPPSHSGQSCARKLSIKIDLNLAWQIHKCWAKSVQKRLCEEDCEFVRRMEEEENPRRGGTARHKRSLSLDRKRSRSCDSRHRSPRMEKTDSVPNMRDIMDFELALQMSREDASEKVCCMWNDVDLATKMKRKLLYERYPFLERSSLDEVFASNNFSLPQTEEQIQNAFGGELPPLGRNEVHATNGQVQRSGLVRKVTTTQSPVVTPVVEEVQDFRAESVLYHQLRQECFAKAKEAYQGGRRGAASFYAQEGHAYTEKIWEANRHASMKILVHRNLGRDQNTIDLHLLYVREAVEMLEIFLKIKLQELMNCNDRRVVVAVITGRGKHSVDQVPRLKRGVINYLCRKNITYHEKQAGLIEVVLTRKEKL